MALTGYEMGALSLPLVAIAAGTDVTNQPVLYTNRKVRFATCYIGTEETVNGHATHYVAMSLMNGSSTIAHTSTVGTAASGLTNAKMKAMTLVAAKREVASGQNVVFKATHNGNGTAVARPILQLRYEIID